MKNFKISVSPFFLLVALLFFHTGFLKEFILMFTLVSIHESTHLMTGLCFKLKPKKLSVLAFGQQIEFEDIDELSECKKIILFLSGPGINLFFYYFSFLFPRSNEFFTKTNLLIALFNLLPVYPLDGGKILYYLLGNRIGILNAVDVIEFASKLIALCMGVMGLIWMILFPFVPTLFVCALYILYLNRYLKLELLSHFYRLMIKKMKNKKQIKKTRMLTVSVECELKQLIRHFEFDHVYYIYVRELKKFCWEENIMEFVLMRGIQYQLKEIVQYDPKSG